MNAMQERVFILFKAGHTRKQIADLCGTTLQRINYVFEKYGAEYVTFKLSKEFLAKFFKREPKELSAELELSIPFIRFVLKHLPPEYQIKSKKLKEDERLTLRCSNCGANFEASLFELKSNPERKCNQC